jgi:nitrous oxide reductase accessory protein NosL
MAAPGPILRRERNEQGENKMNRDSSLMKRGLLLPMILCLWFMTGLTSTAQQHIVLPDGTKTEIKGHCPVCGMKVGGLLGGNAGYSYMEDRLIGFAGVAAAVLSNNEVELFEGARCLFIYNTAPQRFGITTDQIKGKYVTDFVSRRMVDVEEARFVLGSGIKGPMGYDLIPFTNKKEADQFSSAHGGKRIVRIGTVGLQDVDRPEQGSE